MEKEKRMTEQDLREQISALANDEIYTQYVWSEEDFVDIVVENLEVLAFDEGLDFDLNLAKEIARQVYKEELEKSIEEKIKKLEQEYENY